MNPTLVSVVRGQPTELELAVLIAFLAMLAKANPPSPADHAVAPQCESAWDSRPRALGAQPAPGPDAWRRSLLR
ncbi:MAG: acyl-CoA carboxylase subunit epsilon [Bifidobacteriaceae bacterium]|jgi:hypothetical protein|nr:acyl-CoA carboxylase subunit epsilon [Bifidobacteriaceae bacterium]